MELILANRANYGKQRNVRDIKYIVIHYTGNDGDNAKNNCLYFQRKIVKASAHYFVDDYGLKQSVPDNYVAYSVGGKKYPYTNPLAYGKCVNSNSISVELCDCRKNGTYDFTSKTIQNAVVLVKDLMKKYNVPIERVIRHYDVVGKVCPKPFVNDTNAWNNFKSKLIGGGTGKYKVGDVVETNFQVRVLGEKDDTHYRVESNGYLFELHKTMVKNLNKDMIGNVIERGTIFAQINSDTYGIEVLDRQFNIKEYYISKKL